MLRAIYKGGSCVLLKNYNDIDYFYYYDNRVERVCAVRNNKDHKVNNHYRLWEKRLKIFLGCWSYPYEEKVDGEEIVEFKDFNICDHKQEYKACVLPLTNIFKDNDKRWYHILIACYMFENKKHHITKKQLEIVQKVHDEGITKDLKEYCINTLNAIE